MPIVFGARKKAYSNPVLRVGGYLVSGFGKLKTTFKNLAGIAHITTIIIIGHITLQLKIATFLKKLGNFLLLPTFKFRRQKNIVKFLAKSNTKNLHGVSELQPTGLVLVHSYICAEFLRIL